VDLAAAEGEVVLEEVVCRHLEGEQGIMGMVDENKSLNKSNNNKNLTKSL